MENADADLIKYVFDAILEVEKGFEGAVNFKEAKVWAEQNWVDVGSK